ncbi:MAG: four helix bundle protein [Candidatus Levybacteria bacterium]|nr:four helix bundle protein [Candidatus Levybacteria bacterium]
MIKQSSDTYGYKKLLVYRKADELQLELSHLTSHFPPFKTLYSLSDQANRSARSTKQNIVEGWKRNSTSEYYTFLGYSIASNAELEEDCNDIISGKYPELMGKKGIMGEMGMSLLAVESLPFYPLDAHLPPIVQLKLRCKEINFLLDRLQKSLVDKMENDHNLSPQDHMKQNKIQREKEDKWLEEFLKKQ